MKYLYYISDSHDPYINLAQEECLLELASKDVSIMYFWQNENTIVIGRNQDIYAECRVEEFLKAGGLIARRRSGGGAVYQDMGNLNFSLLSIKDQSSLGHEIYGDIVQSGLNKFSLFTSFNDRNDLLINGKKFCGTARYIEKDKFCIHGSLLIDSDIAKMEYYLTPDVSKLARNHVSSISMRVINLSRLSESITVEGVILALTNAYNAASLNEKLNKEKEQNLLKFYSSFKWLYEGQMPS